MKSSDPLVSVCIPTYNRVNKLKRTVEILQNSTYENIEIIISDNASMDETYAFCIDIVKSDRRIKYFRHKKNFGPVKNFEFSRSQAVGEYFMWLSDDDFIDKDYIKKCIHELVIDSGVVVASGLGAYYTNEGKFHHFGNIIDCTSKKRVVRLIRYAWSVGDNSIFYGIYSNKKTQNVSFNNILGADWAWMMGILLKGRAKVVPNIFIHREYEASTSSSIENIVHAQGLPMWNKWLPWTAVCLNLLIFVKRCTLEFKENLSIKGWCEFILIAFIIFLKCMKEGIVRVLLKTPMLKR